MAEPLAQFNQLTASRVSLNADNPFATAYPFVDSVWNAMNALAIIASECGGVDKLHARITEWHTMDGDSYPQLNPTWCADACVLLFGVIYPQSHAIAEPVVPTCYAKALPIVAGMAKRYEKDNIASAFQRLEGCFAPMEDTELTAQGRALWKRFSTRPAHLCPWKVAVAPMLSLILRKQGSHDLTLEEIGEFRNCLNTLCSKGAWLAYSEDGVAPPAAAQPGGALRHHGRRAPPDARPGLRGAGRRARDRAARRARRACTRSSCGSSTR